MKRNHPVYILFLLFIVFIISSRISNFQPGVEMGDTLFDFFIDMVKVLPFIFILIGLFDVWIDRETIERHLGTEGGWRSFLWVFLLAMPMGGGLLPALSIGHALYKKGARLPVILTFLGAVAIGRVPMILLESTFLGWRFSFLRISFSIPIVIGTGILLGRFLQSQNYALPE
ncbi:MAG: permease [Fibrobacterota bacterium]